MAKWTDPGWYDRQTKESVLQRGAQILIVLVVVVMLLAWVGWMRGNDKHVMVPANKTTTSTIVVDCDRADVFCDDEGA